MAFGARCAAENADAVIATTDEDATNIMVMLLADEFEVPSLVSVVQNDEHMALFRQVGANVIENPQRLIGEYLVRAVQRPSVQDFMTLNDGAEVFEITVETGAPIAERSLRDADAAGQFGDDVLVVAIERGNEVLTPKGNVTVHAGDLVTVFSRQGASNEITRIFTGE